MPGACCGPLNRHAQTRRTTHMRSIQVGRPTLIELGARFAIDQNHSARFECFLTEPAEPGQQADKEDCAQRKPKQVRSSSAWQAFLHDRTKGRKWRSGQMACLRAEYENLGMEQRQMYEAMAKAATAANKHGHARYSDPVISEPQQPHLADCSVDEQQLAVYGGLGPDVQEFLQELSVQSRAIRLARQGQIRAETQQLAAYAAAPLHVASASDFCGQDDMVRASLGPLTMNFVQHAPIHLPADVFAEARRVPWQCSVV